MQMQLVPNSIPKKEKVFQAIKPFPKKEILELRARFWIFWLSHFHLVFIPSVGT
jgi:hypothetical protein